MDNINKQGILDFINYQPVKAVESIDLDNNKVKYSSKITSPRNLEALPGGEEQTIKTTYICGRLHLFS